VPASLPLSTGIYPHSTMCRLLIVLWDNRRRFDLMRLVRSVLIGSSCLSVPYDHFDVQVAPGRSSDTDPFLFPAGCATFRVRVLNVSPKCLDSAGVTSALSAGRDRGGNGGGDGPPRLSIRIAFCKKLTC
jgi:hypothetical protein